MPLSPEHVNEALQTYGAYLATLTAIHVDPRLRAKFGLSDVIQTTLLEAFRDVERIESLDTEEKRRWLRRMLLNNLRDEIDRWLTGRRNVRLEQPLQTAAAESSARLQDWLASDSSGPEGKAVRQEQRLRVLEALSRLEEREREALILQRYHGWKLAEIAERLECTAAAVAGLHARALAHLRAALPDMESEPCPPPPAIRP